MTRAHRRAELLRMFNEIAPIAKTFGMRLSFTDDDRAVVDLPFNPGLDHAQAGIHGGVYATLLDTAGWFTAAVAHGDSSWIATSEMSIHFLQPSARVDLRAEGRMIKRGKRQDVVEMLLYDGAGDLVGHGTGTMMVLPHIPLKVGLAGEGGPT
ncbi:MAG: PaaI family thioesterase [Deferrisomatales bacterium]